MHLPGCRCLSCSPDPRVRLLRYLAETLWVLAGLTLWAGLLIAAAELMSP